MTARAHISDRTKLAALVCELLAIPHEHQLLMHQDQVLSLVNWDHYPVPKALGGSDRFSNLRALLASTHKAITAKRDIPTIAKVKRLTKEQEDFQRKVLARPCGEKRERKNTIRSRGFPKQSRPMRRAREVRR